MSEPTINKLKRFVRQRYYAGHNHDADADEGTVLLRAVKLCHMVADDRDVELEAFPVRPDADEPSLDAIASRIDGAAQEHCEGLAGVQRYRLAAYYAGSPSPNGVITFALRSVASDYTGSTVSEPANDKGFFSQLMRHNQELHRSLLASAAANASLIDRLAERNTALEARLTDQSRVHDEVLSQHHQRELAARETAARIEHRGEIVRSVKLLAPAIVNRLAKREVIPGAENNVHAQMARALMESLTVTQIGAVAEALGEDELRAEWLALVGLAAEQKDMPLHMPLRALAAKLDRRVLMTVFSTLTPMQQVSVSELLGLGRPSGAAASSATKH